MHDANTLEVPEILRDQLTLEQLQKLLCVVVSGRPLTLDVLPQKLLHDMQCAGLVAVREIIRNRSKQVIGFRFAVLPPARKFITTC